MNLICVNFYHSSRNETRKIYLTWSYHLISISWRTYQPWTLEPQISTLDLSISDFSNMNFSTTEALGWKVWGWDALYSFQWCQDFSEILTKVCGRLVFWGASESRGLVFVLCLFLRLQSNNNHLRISKWKKPQPFLETLSTYFNSTSPFMVALMIIVGPHY